MSIAAILALLPTIISSGVAIEQGFNSIGALIAKLQADGRATTSAEETAQLQKTLADAGIADAAFDAAFSGV